MTASATWTDARDWTTGELATAAILNTHVRDNETYLRAVALAALALALR